MKMRSDFVFKEYKIDELIEVLDKYKFKQLHIHHTWRPDHSNFKGNNHQAMQESMKKYHVKTNKWSDIGQHLSLFPDGVWLAGRPFDIVPASIKGWNTGALAVEMIGDFDMGKDKLEARQLNEILQLISYFIDKYGKSSIKFHREGPGVTKTCPGTSLDKSIMIKQAKKLGDNNMVTEERIREIMREELKRVDLPVSDWAKDIWKLAKDKGVTDGTRPRGYATREEVISLIEKSKLK